MIYTFVCFCLCWCHLAGVFGAETQESETMSVTEGDSVMLNSGVTELFRNDEISWYFGAENNSLIAIIAGTARIFSTLEGPDGRFRDKLKLDNKTGSLTITNITTEHTGVYKLEVYQTKQSSKTFKISVYARLPIPKITRNSSQMASFSKKCVFLCSVANASHVTLSWFNGKSLLSSINVSKFNQSLSLEVKHEDKNAYSCEIRNAIRNRTTLLDIKLCQTQLDVILFYVLLGFGVGFLLILAVTVIHFICGKRRKTVEMQEENRTDSPLCKSKPRKTKPKMDSVYENVPKRQ